MVVHACNSSIQEVKAGDQKFKTALVISWIQDPLSNHIKQNQKETNSILIQMGLIVGLGMALSVKSCYLSMKTSSDYQNQKQKQKIASHACNQPQCWKL